MSVKVDNHISIFEKLCFLRRHYMTLAFSIRTLESVFFLKDKFSALKSTSLIWIVHRKKSGNYEIDHGPSAECVLATVAIVVYTHCV